MTRKGTRMVQCLGLMMLAWLVGCGGNSTMNGPVVSTPRQFGSLEFTLSTTKAVYAKGEQVPLTLMVKNIGTQSINFTVLGPDRGAQATHNNTIVWQYPQGGSYIPEPQTITLNPGEQLTINYLWDQTDTQGQQIAHGQYTIVAWYSPAAIDNVNISRDQSQTNLSSNPVHVNLQD